MIIYNTTFKISPSIQDDWLEWLQSVHIPEVMATELFSGHQLLRLLEQDDSEGATYILQYHTSSLENYKTFAKTLAPLIEKRARERWKNQYVSFQTVMRAVN